MRRVRSHAAILAALAFATALPGTGHAVHLFTQSTPPGVQRYSFEPGEPAPVSQGDAQFGVEITGGPSREVAYTAKPGVGFAGLKSLHYHGRQDGLQRVRLFDLDIPVSADTQLSYVVFPQAIEGRLDNPANYVAIDLVFSDGTRLSQLGARDQHRIGADARAQGDGRVLYPNQWNFVSIELPPQARGKRIAHVELMHDGPQASFEGYIDAIEIGPPSRPAQSKRPSDYVNTLRGTNSNGNFSRGNNVPAVAVPHGFNFWTPVTNASSSWIYQYQERNNEQNLPRLEALALSHEPSPWMGDRQTFQLMPASVSHGAPSANREARALPFHRANETARAHLYAISFDNGIQAEITPTDHAAMFRFTFPEGRSQLILDNRDNHGSVSIDASSRSFSGWSEVKSRLSTGATRLFFYATVDQPIAESGRLTGEGRDEVTAWIGFDTRSQKQVNLRIATSLISVDQARHNLQLELPPNIGFDAVRAAAQAQWDKQLGIIQVDGASSDELTTLYSNLYRLFLYPNSGFENTGTAEHPMYRHASPFSPPTGENSDTQTGARIVDGQVYVNNGFWDTYRTAWPAYALLVPWQAGDMIDGFVQQYREGGWIARWSSPGYADLMVGTSSDVAFADAWLKGVRNFDVKAFYQSALRNASVVSPIKGTGRKGLERSIFNGYTDSAVNEGLSWSMDGYINDFAIGNLASALAADGMAGDAYHAHYADDAAYYRNRALGYVHLFNDDVQFFVGRDAAGGWRYAKQDFNPERWGGDYTETNAWNMAFHAPQDGAGLAALYGGREQLARKLDRFFETPGNFDVGSYGEVIHEMLEARDVRMGQYGHSNQPSHHIIYMYDVAGEPWKTQDKIRDALTRLYVGSEIGQGYPGDEDNGEMSAWWIFSAAGFYPLRMGAPEYVIGAPYFPRMDIQLESGSHIVIRAPKVSDANRYVQALRINGKPWDSLTIPHALLAEGATLDFDMGPKPSRWGTSPDALPNSITREGKPAPMVDLTDGHVGRLESNLAADALFDNTSDTEVALPAGESTITWHAPGKATVAMYTLTSCATLAAPSQWVLEASADGNAWTVLDQRSGETFPWPRQTRAFAVKQPAAYAHYRLRVTGDKTGWAEIELLGHPAN